MHFILFSEFAHVLISVCLPNNSVFFWSGNSSDVCFVLHGKKTMIKCYHKLIHKQCCSRLMNTPISKKRLHSAKQMVVLTTARVVALSYLLQLSWTVTANWFFVAATQVVPGVLATLWPQNPSRHFASNTVIIFLPENHQTNITRNLLVLIKKM